MKKQVRQYSAEEKSKIVIETIKGELTIAQITSKYGVHATQISNWKKQGLELYHLRNVCNILVRLK